MSGTGARRTGDGLGIIRHSPPHFPPSSHLIAAGFVDTPLSATLLGDRLDERRQQLRATLPIGRVVGPDDVAALHGDDGDQVIEPGEISGIPGHQRQPLSQRDGGDQQIS